MLTSARPQLAQTRESTESRKRQIVEAARKIITSRGMEALTVREIAKEVGISDGDMYRQFTSKKEILLWLIEDIERTLLEAVERSASEKWEPLDSLESVLKVHLWESDLAGIAAKDLKTR